LPNSAANSYHKHAGQSQVLQNSSVFRWQRKQETDHKSVHVTSLHLPVSVTARLR